MSDRPTMASPCRWRSAGRAASAILVLVLAPACGRESPPESTGARSTDLVEGPTVSVRLATGDPRLAPLGGALARVLGANRREFEGHTGTVKGFGAGSVYPQVWLRDSSTIVPFARYLYSRDWLVSWLEEHLSHQRRSGELYDWIANGRVELFAANAPRCQQVYRAGEVVLTADKNTTAADQESSAVHSAYRYWQVTGDSTWLDRRLFGRSILERLEDSLEYVFRDRFDQRLGLVRSAFTADWGDVGPVYADQRAIYLDDATPLVAGVYVNAVAYRAARELSELLSAGGRPDRAATWSSRAERLKEAIDERLWDERRGFFRIHVPAGGPAVEYDDTDIFALGGNALAILAGVASPEQAARIFAIAERRREEYRMPTVAGVLLPPYPTGVFRHPILTEAWTYQNGGQWDWWAGPFVLAEFEQGHARAALRHLGQILDRVEATGGFYEWTSRDGEGRGSPEYAGSAAAIGQALVEGAFGVSLRHEALDIRSRVCEAAASIELREPSTGTRVGYSCEPTPGGLRIAFETEGAAPGRLCALLPASRDPREARLGGTSIPVVTETTGLDRYACVATEWGRGELTLAYDPAP